VSPCNIESKGRRGWVKKFKVTKSLTHTHTHTHTLRFNVNTQTSIRVLPNLMEDRKYTVNCNCITLREEQGLRVFWSRQLAEENIWISETGSSNWSVDNMSV